MRKRQVSDLGTPELHRQHETRDEAADPSGQRRRVRVVDQRPIDRLLLRKHIDRTQWQAAEYLSEAFQAAGWEPKVAMQWRPFINQGLPPPFYQECKTDSEMEFMKAMNAVGGAINSVLYDVVCFQISPSAWATRRGFDARTGLVVLKLALAPLARHYRIR